MKNYDVVIIDSGVYKNHTVFKGKDIFGMQFCFKTDNEFIIKNELADNIGHGTAVFYLINKYIKNEKTLNIQIFSENEEPNALQVIEVLKYIKDNIKCKILHMSNGITFCNEIEQLHLICSDLEQMGIIIVCAFENTGIISYPAAFDEVIGVDWSLDCKRINEYEYVENSCINLRGMGTVQRVPWKEDSFIYVSGSSFAAPHITGMILREHRENGLQLNRKNVLSYFQRSAQKIYLCEKEKQIDKGFNIRKAIIFPINKEIHSIIRYHYLLNCDIEDFYDVFWNGNVGKKCEQIINTQLFGDYVIKNYEQINWYSDFDTIIIGHTKKISLLLGKDILKEILDKCILYQKNVFCFDDLKEYKKECEQIIGLGKKVYYPKIARENIPVNRFGKLHSIGKPILMIMGTSTKQGKFTLQLNLRDRFIKAGYKIGQLGTEPSSLLFGMDEVFAMGYGTDISLHSTEVISIINQQLRNIEIKEPDIILVGAQSHSLQLNMGNTAFYPIMNYELLLASDPDAIILCINFDDSIEYIRRCITFLESFVETTVIALVIFPIKKQRDWRILATDTEHVSKNEMTCYIKYLKQYFDMSIFELDDTEQIGQLFNECVDFFSSEE